MFIISYSIYIRPYFLPRFYFRRACELYAQLIGARTDYGVAHSAKFGHNRFGVDYTGRALLPGFGTDPNLKINIISHSMGSSTARMFASLMAQVRTIFHYFVKVTIVIIRDSPRKSKPVNVLERLCHLFFLQISRQVLFIPFLV